jgi:hypothetical protein
MKKFKISKVLKMAIASVGSLACTMAYAGANQTVGGMRAHFVNTSSNLMAGVLLVAAVAGVAYVGMGLFSLKAASDSAGQSNQNLQKGLVKIVLGGCMIAIPFLMHVSQSVLQSGVNDDSGISIPSGHMSQNNTGGEGQFALLGTKDQG